MKLKLLFFVFVLIFSSGLVINGFSQDDMKFIPNDAFEKTRRPPAVFRHDEHNELAQIDECYICHHVYDDNGCLVEDETSEDQRCSDCHELKASGRKPALMKAFHLNCKGCHEARKDGPTMCGQCHVRNLSLTD